MAANKRAWKLQELSGHNGLVTCASLGRKSGRVLVTGGDDRKVNLWAVGKPTCIMSLSGHTTAVSVVRFSPSEELVAAGAGSGAVKVWDLEASRLVRTLTGHRGAASAADFHPYGDFLATGSADSSIKLWDVRRKGCIFTYSGHTGGGVTGLRFSPDGQWVASAGEDALVKVWDLRAGRLLSQLSGHSGPITDLEFHPHEFLLASGGQDRRVLFWDLETFSMVSSSEPEDITTPLRVVLFHPEGTCLFSAGSEGLRVWGWEPCTPHDSVPIPWGKMQDMATTNMQLIGVASHLGSVHVYVVDLKKVRPLGQPPITLPSPSTTSSNADLGSMPFRHNQPARKSFNKERPPQHHRQELARLKQNSTPMTEEESSTSSSDREDENESFPGGVPDIHEYRAAFLTKRRELSRTPPPLQAPPPTIHGYQDVQETKLKKMAPPPPDVLPAPPPMRPSPTSSPSPPHDQAPRVFPLPPKSNSNSFSTRPPLPGRERRASQSENSVSRPDVMPPSSVISNAGGTLPRGRSLQRKREAPPDAAFRKDSVKEIFQPSLSSSLSDTENNARSGAIRHSPSEPSLARRAASQTRSSSLSRPAPCPSPSPRPDVAGIPVHLVLSQQQQLQMQTQAFPKPALPVLAPLNHYEEPSPIPAPRNIPYTPAFSERPPSVDPSQFLNRKLTPMSTGLGVTMSQLDGMNGSLEMEEAEAIHVLSQGHVAMLTVLSNRHRALQVVYNLWVHRDAKVAVETAVEMGDSAVVLDMLSVIIFRPHLWSLDLCSLLLPSIAEMLQSEFEAYVHVAANALRLVIKNFATVIKTNIQAPLTSVGVDISREDRYNKCMACYSHLVPIRAFVLKRQAVAGKLGHTFRELHILLQALD